MTLPSGHTHVLGIVGHPVAQVRAPEVWTGLFRSHGIDAVCLPIDVAPSALLPFLDGAAGWANLDGLIVTIPHKPAALQVVEHPSARARLVGAANVLTRAPDGGWAGEILDGEGFVDAVRAAGHDVAGRSALVVGSGGVGTAIAVALGASGAAEVAVADVDASRAAALRRRLADAGFAARVAEPSAAGFDLVVNATPVGMRDGDPVPIDCSGLTPRTVVGEVVARPETTPLLSLARQRGCPVVPGMAMMRAQVGAMAAWFGYDRIAAAEGTVRSA